MTRKDLIYCLVILILLSVIGYQNRELYLDKLYAERSNQFRRENVFEAHKYSQFYFNVKKLMEEMEK